MPTKLSKLADLNKIFPPIAVSSIVVATSCFYYYISYYDVEGNELCPRYIRVVFFILSWLNIVCGIPHWFLKPFGGLQRIAGIPGLDFKSAGGCFAMIGQAGDGIHKCFQAFLYIYINLFQTQFAYPLFIYKFIQNSAWHWTFNYYKPLPLLNGKTNLIEHAPARNEKFPHVIMPLLTIIYSYAIGDFQKYLLSSA